MSSQGRWWVIRMFLLVGLLGGLGVLHWKVGQWWDIVQGQQQELSNGPAEDLAAASIRSEIRSRRNEIDAVLALVPTRDQVVQVVAAIEEEAQLRGLEAGVVDIAERSEALAGAGGGILREVELQVEASGDPAELIEYLHAVEHLPYLLHGQTWQLVVGDTVVQSAASAAQAPAVEGNTPELSRLEGRLTGEFVLLVRVGDLDL